MNSAHHKHPRRQRKGDRLLNPDAQADEIRIDHAIAPLDAKARQMERKWGIDRLPGLVSPETAEKYGSAIAKLNAAISNADPEEATRRANVCIRGLAAMDAEAERLGAQPATGEVWEYETDGFRFGVMRDGAEWMAAKERHPDLQLFTMREIAVTLRAMKYDHPLVAEAKKLGGAEIVSIKSKLDSRFWENGGDQIPF